MSRKFFNLIHGQPIQVAPGTKRVPSSDLATLLESKELLAQVQEDAKQYRLEVAKDAEQVKEQAYRDGYEAGFGQWAKALADLEHEIREVHQEIQKLVVPLALKAAQKIIGREVELSPETTTDIVATSLKAVSQHKKIVIWVNKKDLDILEQNKERLRQLFEHLESLSIRERSDIQPLGCIIETEGGIINAQLSHKWEALEQAFVALLEGHPS